MSCKGISTMQIKRPDVTDQRNAGEFGPIGTTVPYQGFWPGCDGCEKPRCKRLELDGSPISSSTSQYSIQYADRWQIHLDLHFSFIRAFEERR